MKPFLVILIFCTLSVRSFAQNFLWETEFYQILDNREYFSKYAKAQTILGARIDFKAGIQIDSTSRIMAWLNYLYEYGGALGEVPLQPDLYYSFDNKKFVFKFGAFPRRNVLNYPLALLTDTLLYYRPNIEGAHGSYNWNWGNVDFWCDWVGRQTMERREAFLAGFNGSFNSKLFYFDYFAYMFHHAGNAGSNKNIRDNGGSAVYAGVNLSSILSFMQLFKFDIGGMGSYDRLRPGPIDFSGGISARVNAHFKRYGFDFTGYWGDELNLAYGDKFYSSGNYARIDLFFVPFKSKYIESRFNWGIHRIAGETNSSQQLFIIVNIEGFKPLNPAYLN